MTTQGLYSIHELCALPSFWLAQQAPTSTCSGKAMVFHLQNSIGYNLDFVLGSIFWWQNRQHLNLLGHIHAFFHNPKGCIAIISQPTLSKSLSLDRLTISSSRVKSNTIFIRTEEGFVNKSTQKDPTTNNNKASPWSRCHYGYCLLQ